MADQVHMSRRGILGSALGLAAAMSLSALSAQTASTYTFAVLGLDTRHDTADQRSDSIMVSRVDLAALTVRTLSIPRDLYVVIPGYGNDKINAAYQDGLEADPQIRWQSGATVTVATIAQNFEVACDGSAVLQLQQMPQVIDAVGGIQVENPYSIHVETFPNFSGGGTRALSFPAGPITLDGAATVDFVRTRQQDGDGGRVMRQNLVLMGLLDKLQQPAMVPRIPELVSQLRDVVHTDIPGDLQARLIAALPRIPQGNVAFTNIDFLLTPGYSAGGAWIYQADWSTLPGYVQGWLAGEID